jgi:syntaxin 1B/2/3
MISRDGSETFLQEAIREQGRGHVIETVRVVQKNLLELHHVFLDVAVAVEEHGHRTNTIEANVNRATSYTEKGVEHLQVLHQEVHL